MQKGNEYFIIFIDPKGTEFTDYERKIDGYRKIFENGDGKPKIFPFNGFNVRFFVFLKTEDTGILPESGYSIYWFDNLDRILSSILEN